MRTFARRRLFFIPLVLVAIVGFAVLTMVLWNALLPVLFHFPVINFWQAAGLLVLCRLLFGGTGPGRHHHPWRNNMREKWENMSPEERERFRQRLSHHYNWWNKEEADAEKHRND